MTGRAVVVGGGGIGAALVDALAADDRVAEVRALRRGGGAAHGKVRPGTIDIGDPASIAAAAADIDGPLDLVIVATGALDIAGHGPERSLRDLDAGRLAEAFRINTIGPALVLRHFAPLLRRDRRATIACLSARVGSIADNRLGGWYGYRAAKAALNQIVRTAAIELARTHPHAVCVALHPGTVATQLSARYLAGVPADRLFTPAVAASRLLAVIDALGPAESGRLFAWDGREIAP